MPAHMIQRPKRVLLFYFEGEAYQFPVDFILKHPDSENLLLPYVGQDITDAFYDAGHSGKASALLSRFRVLDGGNATADKWNAFDDDPFADDEAGDGSAGDLSPSHPSDASAASGDSFPSVHDRCYFTSAAADFDYSTVVMRRRCPVRKLIPYLKKKSGDRFGLYMTAGASAACAALALTAYLRFARQ